MDAHNGQRIGAATVARGIEDLMAGAAWSDHARLMRERLEGRDEIERSHHSTTFEPMPRCQPQAAHR